MSWLIDNNGEYALDANGDRIWLGPGEVTESSTYGLRVIYENLLTSVVATSENINYPDDNVLDEHPKKVWKADDDVTTASLTCSFSGGCNALAIFNTNATEVVSYIHDPNEISWPDFGGNTWVDVQWVFINIDISLEIHPSGNSYSMWATFDYGDVGLVMDITLTAPTTVEAGVVVIGKALGFKNPESGLEQGLIDYSTVMELSNGAFWHKQRDVVRTFNGEMVLERDDGFYYFMHDVARTNSYSPMAWRVTDLDDFEWVLYARFSGQPYGLHAYPSHSITYFSLTEVL